MATSASKKPAPVGTAKALSLHIGLNSVDPKHYGGWSGPLAACEFDANDMADIARSRGISPTVLLSKQATRAKVVAAVRNAAKSLKSGDLFVLSFSGHGGQVPDVTGEEPDKKDETWCLYDGQVIDDEIYIELCKFAKGVRIFVLSDSCHSGTVTRGQPSLAESVNGVRTRMMPPSVAMRTYNQNKAFYDKLQIGAAEAAGKPVVDPDAVLSTLAASSGRITSVAQKIQAGVILISGCQDNQTSMDGEHNGAFTEQLLRVWDQGAFQGSIARLHKLILSLMPPTQSPNLYTLGAVSAFKAQRPFTV
jgi:metacaspase-1